MSKIQDNSTIAVDLFLETESLQVYDGLVATGFLICLLIGLPGNTLALIHFLHSKKQNLATRLYIVASCIDICSCTIHLPLAVNLLNNRTPGLLSNKMLCSAWFFTLLLLQATSMFVVMLMSLTRALVIVCPFYKVNKRSVFLSLALYLVYHCVWNTIYFTLIKSGHAEYFPIVGYCVVHLDSPTISYITFQINYSLCTGIPSVMVLLAFLVSTIKLLKPNNNDVSYRRNRQASITIAYFSLTFLSCNCFTFINQTLFTLTLIWYGSYLGPIYNNKFMLMYGWLLSEVFCTVLNAALNPLLYVCRMKELRLWLLGLFRERSNALPVQVSRSSTTRN